MELGGIIFIVLVAALVLGYGQGKGKSSKASASAGVASAVMPASGAGQLPRENYGIASRSGSTKDARAASENRTLAE